MQAGGIYVILSVRPDSTYHWGMYLPESAQSGVVHHATNASGGWMYDTKISTGLVRSQALVLALKVGKATTAIDIPAILKDPLLMVSDPFTCRIWVLNALEKLREKGVLKYNDVKDVENEAKVEADKCVAGVEQGTSTYCVVDSKISA